jgi:hypothetical protein
MNSPTFGRRADPGFHPLPVIGMPLGQRGVVPRAQLTF